MIIKLGALKLGLLAKKKEQQQRKETIKKVGGTNRRGYHARFLHTPPSPPPAPPCGIVKIVAGCTNFCMCVCVCVCGSVSTAVERFLLHYLRYLWAS